jgi:hypothetical protein
MKETIMTTIRDLLDAGFNIDTPLYGKQNDDPDDDNVIALNVGYELTVTVQDCYNDNVQAILLAPSDRLGEIVHD